MVFLISLVATVGPNPELHRGDSLRRWLIAGMWFVTLLILTWALVAWGRRRREIGRGRSGLDPAAPAPNDSRGGLW